MIIDFHACPSIDLSLIKNKLSLIKTTKVVLQPIDALPLLHVLPNNFSLFKELSISNRYVATLLSKFVIELTSMWHPRMYDNVKLWYEAHNMDPNFFIPFASINPALGVRYVREKLDELNELNIRGIVVSPSLQLFDPLRTKAFGLILEYIEGRNMLLVMHLDPCPHSIGACIKELMPDLLNDILERYSVTIVLSALGVSESMIYSWLNRVSRLMRRYDRVYIETSGITCTLFNTSMGKRFIKLMGIDRIIYGSGYPYMKFKQVIKELRCLETSEFLKRDLEAVLYDNAKYLLN
ncbi:MAG: amidohydrolase family protein [Vulcanisaeta sp. AZ3]|jgi:predicted TIM-barrel fold metal-dependent hydrolase|nr:MAG: amidohydrolase [Vulcanisaeta sp. AZ3]